MKTRLVNDSNQEVWTRSGTEKASAIFLPPRGLARNIATTITRKLFLNNEILMLPSGHKDIESFWGNIKESYECTTYTISLNNYVILYFFYVTLFSSHFYGVIVKHKLFNKSQINSHFIISITDVNYGLA